MRPVLAVVVPTFAAALGALFSGEYPLMGFTGFGWAVGIAIAVAELAMWVGKDRSLQTAAGCALLAATSMRWGVFISFRHGADPPPTALAAIALAGLVGVAWITGSRAPAAGNPPAT